MDTRSKKFDKSMISKTIAFLLAILMFALAATGFLLFLQDSEVDDTQLRALLRHAVYAQGADAATEISDLAVPLTNRMCDLLLRYGDGSEAYYEKEVKQHEAALSKQFNAAVENILIECKGKGNGNPLTIAQYYVRDHLISLRKIGNHEKHYLTGILDYGDYGYDYDDGNHTVYEEYDDPADEAFTTTLYYENDRIPQGAEKIPKRITKQLGADEIAVELCNCVFDGENFDGYYALSVDVDYFRYYFNYAPEDVFYDSYTAFYEAYSTELNDLQSNKLWYYLFLDAQGHVVLTNCGEVQSPLSAAQAETLMRGNFDNYDYGFVIQPAEGSVAYLKGSMEQARVLDKMQRCFDSTQWSGVKGTLYLVLDVTKQETLWKNLRDEMIVWCLELLLSLLCVVYLIIRSGRKHGDDELHLLPTDHCFTLLRTAINFSIIAFGAWGWLSVEGEYILAERLRGPLIIAGRMAVAAALMAVLIDWLLFVARHVKNHDLFKNILLVWLFEKIERLCKDRKEKRVAQPPVYRDLWNDVLKRVLLMAVLPNIIVGGVSILFVGGDAWAVALSLLILLFAYDCFLVWYVLRYAYHLRVVMRAVHEIREGNYDLFIDTAKMPAAVRAYATDVMQVRNGLRTAVQSAVKDERMRAELITNVSHDLKTPLTSIINYVDLLSRCEIDDETAQGYIAVLGDKSNRLKKLIEDLVEASKASAGAMKVELMPVSLNELAVQIIGEYADAFAARQLELICQERDDAVIVSADSKLSYRVLDNLMGNIKKYAMPGTRVYLTLEKYDGCGVVTLRNISEHQLNISVEELMERFVRGDAARATEGSGLGLSIAEDLCKLQGAALTLDISGDLFTASVAFKLRMER